MATELPAGFDKLTPAQQQHVLLQMASSLDVAPEAPTLEKLHSLSDFDSLSPEEQDQILQETKYLNEHEAVTLGQGTAIPEKKPFFNLAHLVQYFVVCFVILFVLDYITGVNVLFKILFPVR